MSAVSFPQTQIYDSNTNLAADGNTLLQVPEEQNVIQTVKRLHAQGIGYRAICRELEAIGQGRRWHPQTVKNILMRAHNRPVVKNRTVIDKKKRRKKQTAIIRISQIAQCIKAKAEADAAEAAEHH